MFTDMVSKAKDDLKEQQKALAAQKEKDKILVGLIGFILHERAVEFCVGQYHACWCPGSLCH